MGSQKSGEMPLQYSSGSALPLHAVLHNCQPPIRLTADKSSTDNPVFLPRTAQFKWQLDLYCNPVGSPALSKSHIAWCSLTSEEHSHAVGVVTVVVVAVRKWGGTLVSVPVVVVLVFVVVVAVSVAIRIACGIAGT